jgi:hypothetical protein
MESSVHLTLAAFVLRHKLHPGAPDSVTFLVSDLLVADLALAEACALSRVGSVALLNLVWMRSQRRSHPSTFSKAKLLQSEPHYRRWAFSQTLQEAVKRGDLALIQWTLAHFPSFRIPELVVTLAAQKGKLWFLQHLETEKPQREIAWGQKAFVEAAKEGHWELVHWLLQHGPVSREVKESNSNLVMWAFDQNNLAEFKWAVAQGFNMKRVKLVDPPILDPKVRTAVEERSLERGRRGPTDTLEKQWGDRTLIFRFMVEEKLVPLHSILPISWRPAARYGDLPFMKWLAERRGSARRRPAENANLVEALKAAAEKGHLAVVQWILSTFTSLGLSANLSETMFTAAQSGQVEVVHWLHQQYSRDPRIKLFMKHEMYISDDESEDDWEDMDDIDESDDGEWEEDDSEEHPLHKQKARVQGTAMDAAAMNGHLDALDFLHSISVEPRGEEQSAGGRGGNTQQSQSARGGRGRKGGRGGRGGRGGKGRAKKQRDRVPYCTTAAMDLAAAAGRLSIVKWLHANRKEGCTKAAMDRAAENGHLEVVKFLHNNRSEGCTTRAIDRSARNCFLEGLGGSASADAAFATPRDEKRFEVIKFLFANRSEGCTPAAMTDAAANGNLVLLKWLHAKPGSRCTPRAMDEAAGGGYLDIVKWLHENRREGCTTEAMDEAAAEGHLEVVKWLHEYRKEGCTTAAMDEAAANGELEVVEWLAANVEGGCTSVAIEEAAGVGDLDMVKLLHGINPNLLVDEESDDEFLEDAFGLESDDDTDELALRAEARALVSASAGGHLAVVQWLIENCDDPPIMRAMTAPILNGHFELLLYLHSELMGMYDPADLLGVWNGLRHWQMQEQTPQSQSKDMLAWFTENYPCPANGDVERGMGGTHGDFEEVRMRAVFARMFLR